MSLRLFSLRRYVVTRYFVTSYSLPVARVRCPLLITRYSLPVTRHLLFVTRYSLLVTRYSLLVTRYSLPVACTRCYKENWSQKSTYFLDSLTYLKSRFARLSLLAKKIWFEVELFPLFRPYHCGLKISVSSGLWRMVWGRRITQHHSSRRKQAETA